MPAVFLASGRAKVMHVRVLFFGALKDVVGLAEERLQLEPGCDVEKLFEGYSRRFPALKRHRSSLLFSRNREFVGSEERLKDGDEVAFLPPVSGGAPTAKASKARSRTKVPDSSGDDSRICGLTHEPIDSRAMAEALTRPEDGAVVVFEGVVRNHSKGRSTKHLEYESYEPMALEKMREICDQILDEYAVDRIGMVHRLGHLDIGEVSVAIMVTAEHRKPAFEACHAAIDRLKKIVPIWKKEFFADGAIWVEGEGASIGRGEASPTDRSKL
jgi:molybdopterin synthase catalytic subunit/molybdopterin converting factor small subunit